MGKESEAPVQDRDGSEASPELTSQFRPPFPLTLPADLLRAERLPLPANTCLVQYQASTWGPRVSSTALSEGALWLLWAAPRWLLCSSS